MPLSYIYTSKHTNASGPYSRYENCVTTFNKLSISPFITMIITFFRNYNRLKYFIQKSFVKSTKNKTFNIESPGYVPRALATRLYPTHSRITTRHIKRKGVLAATAESNLHRIRKSRQQILSIPNHSQRAYVKVISR